MAPESPTSTTKKGHRIGSYYTVESLEQSQWTYLCRFLDFVKANFDGAVFPSEGFSSIGVVVRDDAGNFIAGLSKRIPDILAPDVAETNAAKFATKLLVELGYSNVALEGDNLKIVKKLQQYDFDDLACGMVIDDVLQLLRNFTKWEAIWISRSLNGAAHSFARNACTALVDHLWNHSPPSFVLFALQADLLPS
ncbi:uncharacterized protein [Coffea arabica]|uniref:RNase H type-1 domain-containing protein n=1 Tax=Coffea arabica TaxID=13443 RepID=A0ABM4U1G3_COFAR